MSERRFTDREVALIFERATEPRREEGDRDTGGRGPQSTELARGLSLTQLQEIGREVGIPAERIARAVAELHRPKSFSLRGFFGPDPVRREIRSIPTRLSDDEIAELIRVMDERVPAQGTVTEALGSVRWSAFERGLSRQLSVDPGEDETLVRVEERYSKSTYGVAHFLPTAYGIFGGFVIGAEAVGGVGAAFLGAVVLGLVAWSLGRLIWAAMSGRSAARTHALAEELAEVATRISGAAERPALPATEDEA